MSEEIREYNSKSITYTNLAIFLNGFCKQKIFENVHKGNPLDKTYIEIDDRIMEEYDEFDAAFTEWQENPTDKNRNNVLREIADIGNFWMFMAGKIAGYEILERR